MHPRWRSRSAQSARRHAGSSWNFDCSSDMRRPVKYHVNPWLRDRKIRRPFTPASHPFGQNLSPLVAQSDGNLLLKDSLSTSKQYGSAVLSFDTHTHHVPFSYMPMPFLTLVAETPLPSSAALGMVQSFIRGMGPQLAIHNLMPLESGWWEIQLRRGGSPMVLLLVFSALALCLAFVGIYGVVSSLVGQRTAEIGVRIALGAKTAEVMRLIATANLRTVVVAIAAGVGAAIAAGRTLQDLVYGISVLDWGVYAAATLIALFAAAAATCVPALHAARIDPVRALRNE